MNSPIVDTLDVYRHEVKYFISRHDAFLLQQMLSKCMQTDLNSNDKGEYWIRSLYYDSIDNNDYVEKINGLPQRKKLRLRIYNINDSNVKLEIKNKSGNYIHKKTTQIDRSDAYTLINGDNSMLLKYKNEVANMVYTYMHMERLRPVVLIDYERLAFTYPFENIRITIDKDVRASLDPSKMFEDDIPMLPVFSDGRYILEIKYQTMLPSFIRTMISTINPQISSISKYCLCRQAVNI